MRIRALCQPVQGYRVTRAGGLHAVRGAGAVDTDTAGTQRAWLDGAAGCPCFYCLAGQGGGLGAGAVRRGPRGQDEQPGTRGFRDRNADRGARVKTNQVPPALRRGGEIGEVARDPAVGTERRERGPGGDERIGELSDLWSNRKVGVHEGSFVCRLWLVTPAEKCGVSDNTRKDSRAPS
jgi:hypothetical protein